MKKIKVLHIGISSESGVFGGVEKYMIDYYSHMDHTKVVFDFLFCRENSLVSVQECDYMRESKITALHVLRDKDNSLLDFYNLYKKVYSEISNENYDVIHVDTSFAPVQIACLWAAKKNKKRVRIAHAHSSGRNMSGNVVKKIFKNITYMMSKAVIRYLATDYFACSKKAGENLFGSKGVYSERFIIIKNAIEADKYIFNSVERKNIRDTYCISTENVVLGCVGRLDPVKNIPFTIDVFEKYHEINENSELWIIGDGAQKEELIKYINKKKLEEVIMLWGQRADISDLMQGMDVLLFPSLHEGLGIAAVEAQAAGLPVYASVNIPEETAVTNLIHFNSITEGATKWAYRIQKNLRLSSRRNTYQELLASGYDIYTAANELENIYIKRTERQNL